MKKKKTFNTIPMNRKIKITLLTTIAEPGGKRTYRFLRVKIFDGFKRLLLTALFNSLELVTLVASMFNNV